VSITALKKYVTYGNLTKKKQTFHWGGFVLSKLAGSQWVDGSPVLVKSHNLTIGKKFLVCFFFFFFFLITSQNCYEFSNLL
jgi:hypothetical protein